MRLSAFCLCLLSACVLVLPGSASAQVIPGRYIVTLNSEPAGAPLARRGMRPSRNKAEFTTELTRVHDAQKSVRTQIEARGGKVVGSADTVANMLVVTISRDQVDALRSLPGVKSVSRTYKIVPKDDSLSLTNVTKGWSLLPNGMSSAGQGMKIGVLDTGIDVTAPAFQGFTQTPPSGFPIADTNADKRLTNNKVIVARNYTSDSDASDGDGHGTATSSTAAGLQNNTADGTASGSAPGAFLGNYKILGVSSGGSNDLIIQALDDSAKDGMDVDNMSVGPNLEDPVDSDPLIQAVEQVSALGTIVVIADGNEGPQLNTIAGPSSAPSSIAVGSSQNDYYYPYDGGLVILANQPVYMGVPSNEDYGNNSVTGPLVDVATVDASGLACSSLPRGSLTGNVVLIERGTCTFETKLDNAQAAGAIGAILYLNQNEVDAVDLYNSFGESWTQGNASLPGIFIGYADGLNIKSQLAATPGITTTLYLDGNDSTAVSPQHVSSFSSAGPGQSYEIKPDMVATGDPVIIGAETIDSSGELYDPSGYTIASGTSFSSPLTAGAVAVVKAARPGLTIPQYRSLIVNATATFKDENGTPIPVMLAGAGLLNLASSLQATVTSQPVSVSFGVAGATNTNPAALSISNVASSADTLTLSVVSYDGIASPTLSTNSLSLNAGASQSVNLQMNTANLGTGTYQGYVRVQSAGSNTEIHIPYWYAVPTNTPAQIGILYSDVYDNAGQLAQQAITFRVVDATGTPLGGVTPTVTVVAGNGSVSNVYPDDPLLPGTWDVDVNMDPVSGAFNVFQITAGGVTNYVEIISQ